MVPNHRNARPSGDTVKHLISLLVEAQSITDTLSMPEVGARLQDILDLLDHQFGRLEAAEMTSPR